MDAIDIDPLTSGDAFIDTSVLGKEHLTRHTQTMAAINALPRTQDTVTAKIALVKAYYCDLLPTDNKWGQEFKARLARMFADNIPLPDIISFRGAELEKRTKELKARKAELQVQQSGYRKKQERKSQLAEEKHRAVVMRMYALTSFGCDGEECQNLVIASDAEGNARELIHQCCVCDTLKEALVPPPMKSPKKTRFCTLECMDDNLLKHQLSAHPCGAAVRCVNKDKRIPTTIDSPSKGCICVYCWDDYMEITWFCDTKCVEISEHNVPKVGAHQDMCPSDENLIEFCKTRFSGKERDEYIAAFEEEQAQKRQDAERQERLESERDEGEVTNDAMEEGEEREGPKE